ncbi:MAG: hypothetical protein ACXADU_07515 [Promethearchaeota archaeon]|jgi:hypothetical protein
MPYVVARWRYPSHKAEEVNEIYQKRIKDGPPEAFVPGIGEFAVPGAFKASENGFQGISFTKVTPENVIQAMANVATITSLYNNVEGYEWDLEVWFEIPQQPAE